MRIVFLVIAVAVMSVGCNRATDSGSGAAGSSTAISNSEQVTLPEARDGFTTKIVRTDDDAGPPDVPPGGEFELIRYQSAVGPLAAYLSVDPSDGQKHPAVVWITGGDNNSIGDVWSPSDRGNDQSVSAFREAGIVMMFPSQRGGNDNPGQREGFYGEVDDVLAATDHLAALPYVNPDQIYLGGHSTGGTLVMLVGECSDRYRAIFSLGGVAAPEQYGGQFVYCDTSNPQEMRLRSPIYWMHGVNSPMYVLEGEHGNWDGALSLLAEKNTNPQVQFFKIPGHDHFSVIAPLIELLADQIIAGQINITEEMVQSLR